MRTSILLPALLLLALAAAPRPGDAPARVGYAWPLKTCIVSGEPLGEGMVIKVLEDAKDPSVNGREVRFCCTKCVETFDANREKYLREADKTIEAMELPFYPPIHCVIMPDEALPDPKGADAKEAHHVVVGNQLVRTCCAQCVRKVKRNPAVALARVENAVIAAQAATYPLKVCPFSGRDLTATSPQTLLAGRLARFCCDGCRSTGEKDPSVVLSKLDAAMKK